jgi:hypothetical protein
VATLLWLCVGWRAWSTRVGWHERSACVGGAWVARACVCGFNEHLS